VLTGADPGISGGGGCHERGKNRQGSGGRRRPPAGSRGRAPGGGEGAKPPMKVTPFHEF
jgi:hypothetical protein